MESKSSQAKLNTSQIEAGLIRHYEHILQAAIHNISTLNDQNNNQ